jgi:HPt (histidine-containing phosphotransfer) domain-containing protein
MGLHLSSIFSDADSSLDSEQSYPWQEALLKALPQLLPISTDQRSGQDVLLAADRSAYSAARQIPVWALVVVSYLLGLIPEQTLPVARAVVAATAVAAEREALTAWDASVLLPSCVELVDILQEAASTAEGPLAVLQVQKMQQEAMQVQDVLEGLLKYVYQHRDGAPAAVLQALPVVAAQVGVEMPQQSRKILEAAEAAAQEREQQLQQALLLHEQGGPAMPEDLLQGWDELGSGEPGDVVARYAEEPLQAALVRRMYWLGAAVTDGWVLKSLSG